MNKSWTSPEHVMNKLWTNLKISEQDMNKSWTSCEQVMSKLWTSHEQVKNKSWKSYEQVMNKLWTDWEQEDWGNYLNYFNQLYYLFYWSLKLLVWGGWVADN